MTLEKYRLDGLDKAYEVMDYGVKFLNFCFFKMIYKALRNKLSSHYRLTLGT